MKTILLVGGFGTRLRPLTNSIAKPMVPLVNRPFTEYTLDLLKHHGLKEIIFSSFYLPEALQNYFGDGKKFGVSIDYCLEPEPRGTAGAIKNCEQYLDGETFLIFNGDVLTDLNLSEMIELHRQKKALATIALGKVIDPTAFGMIDLHEDGKVKRWFEKPSWDEVTSRWVNIGASVFEPEVLDRIPANEAISIERQTYPEMIDSGAPIYGYQAPAYWLDIGTPPKYMRGIRNILTGVVETSIPGKQLRPNLWVGDDVQIDKTAAIKGPVVIGDHARIGAGVTIIGPAVIGANVEVGKEVFIEESAIWDDCILGARASLTGTILGKGAVLKPEATLKDGCIVENRYTVEADRVYDNDTVLSFP